MKVVPPNINATITTQTKTKKKPQKQQPPTLTQPKYPKEGLQSNSTAVSKTTHQTHNDF